MESCIYKVLVRTRSSVQIKIDLSCNPNKNNCSMFC